MPTAASVAVCLLAFVWLGVAVGRVHAHLIEHIDRQVNHLERITMSATQDAVNAVVVKLQHAREEIVQRLSEVQAQLDAGVPAEEVDLSALTEAAQALDDIVPDVPEVPAEAPTEVSGDPAEV